MASATSMDELLETPQATTSAGDPVASLGVHQRQEMISQFVEDFHADVYRFSYRLTGDENWAEDTVQNTFLRAFERLEQLKDVGKARSWLLAIARTTFLGELRKRKSWVFTDTELDGSEVMALEVESTVDVGRLQKALMEMPEQFRLVVVMHYLEQESYRSIAEQLSIPIGTVMSRLSRAKKMLKAKLMALSNQNDGWIEKE